MARFTDVGNGCSLAFATSAFSAALLSIDGPGLSRPSVETTHMGTTVAKTFVPGDLYDPGELDLEFAFDPSLTPPISGALEVITITWAKHSPIATAATWVASGFLTDYKPGAKLDTRMTATAKLKLSGAITITPAA